jgi:hypothetical protein
LLYSFSADSYVPSVTYNCDSLIANGGPVFAVRVWVADGGNDANCNGTISWNERNTDFCTTSILVLDNTNTCDGDMAGIVGSVLTEGGDAVRNVAVSLKGPVSMPDFTTDQTGTYHFYSLPPMADYVVSAFNDRDHRNGVSTLDLIHIHRHLLSVTPLGSPYKLIAADANNSGSLSAIDIYEIRKLILGRSSRFESNTSWRFVPKNFVFPDPYKPWPFDEQLLLNDLDRMAVNSDFVAVKVGDVNQSVKANLQQEVEIRGSRPEVVLGLTDARAKAGDVVRVPVFLDEEAFAGMQFTMETGRLTLAEIEAGTLQVNADNINAAEGYFTFSWHDVQARSIAADEPAFVLVFTAEEDDVRLLEQLHLSDALTESEGYVEVEEDIVTADLSLAIEAGEELEPAEAGEFVLYQNRPNPFRESTQIGFSVPADMRATLTVYSAAGQLLHTQEMDARAGYNAFTVNARDLPRQAVLYYKVDAGLPGSTSASDPSASYSATKKMVILD